jgi:acyl-coenzyme A synthetase/AMP-(fatty) acid ligase
MVRRAPEGDLRYLCRTDDMLNLGGFRVAPAEIEQVVRAADGVADCAAVGYVDGSGLQHAAAYVVAANGVGPDDVRRRVRAALKAGLAPFKHPSRLEVVDTLPTTSTGKLARFKLRESASHETPVQ